MILGVVSVLVFFFKQKTAYELRISDWSSDVCSSDLMDMTDALDPARIGDDRMAAIEDADLHRLEGVNMAGEGNAHLLQRRPPPCAPGFQHPLAGRFSRHGHRVVEA